MTLVTGLVGIVRLGAFLGIMVRWIQAPRMTIIVVTVMLLPIYDFVRTLRYGEDGRGR